MVLENVKYEKVFLPGEDYGDEHEIMKAWGQRFDNGENVFFSFLF